MKILFVGDIVGEPGRNTIFHGLYNIKKRENVDFCIANGENSARNGRGMSGVDARDILDAGVDVITMGNHVWSCPEFEEFADRLPVVRPANIGRGRPGRGFLVTGCKGVRIGVANVEGRAFIDLQGDDPFGAVDDVLEGMAAEGAAIRIIDFHGEATSEKKIAAIYADGRATAVIGTHTHVQTADETVLDGGLGFISDAGMTGIARESCIGMNFDGVYKRFALGKVARFEVQKTGTHELCGVVLTVDETTGKTLEIKRIKETVEV